MSSEVKLFRLCGSAPVIDMRTGHNATLRSGLVVLSEDAHTNALAALEAECGRLRVKLMVIASAEPARHCIEWAKAIAAEGNNEVYAKWREAIDEARALAAENAQMRNSMLRLVTTHCAAAIKGQAADAELEQYLAAGIAQLEGQRDKLAAELAAIKGQQPVAFYWQDIGYPEPRKHGPYFGWPSESALRNVDGVAIPVPLYTLPPTSHDQEGA